MNSNYSLIFLLFFFISCYSTDKESNEEKKAVHNQLSSNVEITLTEMGNVKALVTAELLERNDDNLELQLTNNVVVDLYDSNYYHTSTIKSDYAFVSEKENRINAFGNVIVKADKGEELLTDSLLWNNKVDKIFTDSELIFISGNLDTLYGKGFQSNIDLTEWKINQPRGSVKDE